MAEAQSTGSGSQGGDDAAASAGVDMSQARLAFKIGAGEPDQFLVLRYRGSEGLGQLYRFEIELSTTQESVAFEEIVGQAAVLSISTQHGSRWFHGIISRFEMTGESPELTYYRAELVPAVWRLSHRYGCRIFQNQSAKEIITDVLTRAGLSSQSFRFELEGETPAREYCVQYRETDLNFVCRLLEEEGIWWYFEHESHVLVMADSTSAYKPLTPEPQLRFEHATGLNVPDEHVFKFRLGQGVRPGAAVLRDFTFKNPPLNLEAQAGSERDSDLEFFDYPGEYVDQNRGGDLARKRAEEFEAGRTVGQGESNSYRLGPGKTFELTDHPSAPTNGNYLVTSAVHFGRQSTTRTSSGSNGTRGVLDTGVHQSLLAARNNSDRTISQLAEALLQIVTRLKGGDPTANRALSDWLYHAGQVSKDLASIGVAAGANPLEALSVPNLIDDINRASVTTDEAAVFGCRFSCIPATVVYRPPRVTPWPVMRGAQTARVVGPEGEEIHCDEYGRVKVQFNWDRQGEFNDASSCWIRVSQGFAGGQYGNMFIPRIGQEVLVDFLEGNPDAPMIVGRVYNADHMPPYKLPDHKTRSCIKTNSSLGGKGTNEIRFEDLKDSEQVLHFAQKDLHIRVNNDRVEAVGNNRHLYVECDRIEQVKKGDFHLKLDEGNRTEEIGCDQSLTVKGKVSTKIEGTCSTEVGGDVVDKFGGNHKHEVTSTYALKAMSIKLEATAGIELKCGGSSIVLTPAAIFIVGGPLVNINSGSGPPVSPVTAQATSPETCDEPAEADSAEPGKDTNYTGGEPPPSAEPEPDVQVDKPLTTWISIELVDEADMPIPSEPYKIVAPDGETIRSGSLDANGKAYIPLPEPQGQCMISFPRLDSAAWERI
jgi:uncharacterized protein involved in type VI secretion and phage assembly